MYVIFFIYFYFQRYLSQFGYLPPANPTSGGFITEDTMSKAISEFQSFAGLNVTGKITLLLMFPCSSFFFIFIFSFSSLYCSSSIHFYRLLIVIFFAIFSRDNCRLLKKKKNLNKLVNHKKLNKSLKMTWENKWNNKWTELTEMKWNYQ